MIAKKQISKQAMGNKLLNLTKWKVWIRWSFKWLRNEILIIREVVIKFNILRKIASNHRKREYLMKRNDSLVMIFIVDVMAQQLQGLAILNCQSTHVYDMMAIIGGNQVIGFKKIGVYDRSPIIAIRIVLHKYSKLYVCPQWGINWRYKLIVGVKWKRKIKLLKKIKMVRLLTGKQLFAIWQSVYSGVECMRALNNTYMKNKIFNS